MEFLSLLSLISSSQVQDGPHPPANGKEKERMRSQNTLAKHCADVSAHHQLSVGKAVEVTEAVQQSNLHSFSTKSLELWVSL